MKKLFRAELKLKRANLEEKFPMFRKNGVANYNNRIRSNWFLTDLFRTAVTWSYHNIVITFGSENSKTVEYIMSIFRLQSRRFIEA